MAEVLSLISDSPTGIQPVFDRIVRNAARLCQSVLSAVYRRDASPLPPTLADVDAFIADTAPDALFRSSKGTTWSGQKGRQCCFIPAVAW